MSIDASDPSLAPATLRVYGTAWRYFTRWCETRGYESLPATPQAVAAYFSDRAGHGTSYSTIRAAAAAIRHQHEALGMDSPTLSLLVRRTLGDLRKRAEASRPGRRRPEPTSGITESDFTEIQASALLPRTGPSGRTESERAAHSRGAVDIAMISAMRDAPLQGSEAVALTWGDVEFMQDGSAWLTIRPARFPGAPAEAAILSIGRAAATALKAIRGDATDTDPVFRLRSVKALGNRIRAAATAAGLEGVYGVASPRIGKLQDLAEAGVSDAEIRRKARLRVPPNLAALLSSNPQLAEARQAARASARTCRARRLPTPPPGHPAPRPHPGHPSARPARP